MHNYTFSIIQKKGAGVKSGRRAFGQPKPVSGCVRRGKAGVRGAKKSAADYCVKLLTVI